MKILIIDNSSIVERAGRHYTNQSNGEFLKQLLYLHHEVTWFQIVTKNSESISVFDLNANGVKTKGVKALKNKLLRYIYSYILSVLQIFKADFIYIYYPSAFKYVGLLCKILKKPYGLYIRGMNDLTSNSSKLIISNANIILTVSDNFTRLVQSYNWQIKAATIRPMVQLNISDISKGYKVRFIGDKVNILFLGRIDADKGIVELIRAVCNLNKNGDARYNLTIVGTGIFIEEAKRLAIGADFVKFVGGVYDPNEKATYYSNADIFVLPTYHEGFPRTLYEAMAYGTPIITTMVGGIPGLMRDKYNCIEIDVKSVDSIETKIKLLQNNPKLCQTIVANGYKTLMPIMEGSRMSHAESLNYFLKEIL